MEYGQKSHGKKHKRRQFMVDAGRVELDQYMLAQIKKNKRSVRSLRKEVVSLRREVAKLQEQHDDYMLLEKTRTPDYSHSHHVVNQPKSHNRISLLQQGKKHKYKLQSNSLGKDNSLISVSSSASSIPSLRNNSKTKRNCNHPLPNSKSRLSKKIQQLKSKALLQQREKDKIKRELQQKIKSQVTAIISKQLIENSKAQTPTQPKQEQAISEDYQKLLELLKTSRSKKPTQSIENKQSPKIIQFSAQTHPNKNQLSKQDNVSLDQEQSPQLQLKRKPETIHSSTSIPMKSTIFYQNQDQRKTFKQLDENMFKSQTNLLDSSPSRTPQDSPRRPNKNLQFSRAVDVCIVNEQSSVMEGSGNFEGIFGYPPAQIRSGTVEMSFQGGDNSKRRLRQLQFEFDQLVRQQLIASDPREKQMLSQTIRSVLWSINELKAKMSSKGSKDSG